MSAADWPAWAERITEAGVYDIAAELYHLDPVEGGSLSSSGARRLMPPSCPALFRHEQLHPPAPKKEFEVGHAAHQLVLGSGPKLVLIKAERWDTKDVKAEVAAVRADGAIPLKAAEYQMVHDMADVLRAHPTARVLFDPAGGRPEETLVWQDGPTRVWRRARLDWLPNPSGGRLIIPDYKTGRSADPDSIQRAVHAYGYHQQAAWYIDGAEALGLGDDPAFLFVVQEKVAPYLVTVVELGPTALYIGRDLNRRAIELYEQCMTTGRWPGYSDDIELIPLPGWVENRYLQETA